MLLERFVDPLRKTPYRFIAKDDAIDKHRGCAANTDLPAVLHVGVDPVHNLRRCHFFLKHTGVKAQRHGDFFYFTVAEVVVIFKKQIVKLPEFSMITGNDGGPSRGQRPGMAAQGVMLKDDFDLPGMLLEHLLKFRHKARAIRSLKIAENRNGNRCGRKTFDR